LKELLQLKIFIDHICADASVLITNRKYMNPRKNCYFSKKACTQNILRDYFYDEFAII
jgi:hypothetical protein